MYLCGYGVVVEVVLTQVPFECFILTISVFNFNGLW